MFQSLRDLGRLLHAARVLARHDALLPREFAGRVPPQLRLARALAGRARAADSSLEPGVRLALALQSLGPPYIKLGQLLATRPDIIGDETAAALATLQDRLPPFPTARAKEEVEGALGAPLAEMFETFDEPFAAASVAQVHRATTNDEPARAVAVKILRPGVETEFARDLSAFAFAARWAERFFAEARRLRVRDVVDTLAASVALELDLRMEAAAASELAERTARDVEFRVPAVDWSRTASRVLTTEWVEGTPLRTAAELEAAGHDPGAIAVLIVRQFLTQALRDGFFHADMHQGNLFIDAEGRLVCVDFGIMGRLDMGMRRFMAETLAGFLARDYQRVANVHFEAGFVPRRHPAPLFAQALRAIGEPVFGQPASHVSMARLLQQLFDTTRRFDMELQPQLVLLQKTMVVVEGVARSLDPDIDIWEAARPVVEGWMIEQVGPEARLRDAAEGLNALGRLAREFPHLLHNAEVVSAMLADGGLRLHPDTAQQIAQAQVSRTRHVRIALWIAAGALVVLAVGML
ncbi:MAG TPA: 2-polyprenylphenol 6-hydroxylase [Rhizomicrobium sp.]|jgi:ubiquinone biosynthesis protein|nr:2-polyprenylphenol 6-hydroxylase [Rhizomicrobium sp.]